MDSALIVVFLVIVGVVVVVLSMASSKGKELHDKVAERISSRGIQQSTIKQSKAYIYHGALDVEHGTLVLTWDTLFFFPFKDTGDKEIPISTIRSTSSTHRHGGTEMEILTDEITVSFGWSDVHRGASGVGASSGGGFAGGMGSVGQENPNVQEWIHLIDDLRFGRLKKT